MLAGVGPLQLMVHLFAPCGLLILSRLARASSGGVLGVPQCGKRGQAPGSALSKFTLVLLAKPELMWKGTTQG